MIRKIKFRAKAIVNIKELGVKVGDFVFGCYIESGCDAPCIIFGDGVQVEIDKKTLGQFTGMKDKFHKEIYEHDVVSSDYYLPEMKSIAVIKFEQEDNWCRFGFDSGEQDAFRYGVLTVIGDIHSNPELKRQP